MNDKKMEMQLKKSIQEYEVGYKSLQNAIEYAIENKAPNYVQYINSVFVGDRVAKNIKVGDVTSCEAQCSTDKSCSGATFFPITSTCISYTGDGMMVPSRQKNIAIVSDITTNTDNVNRLQQNMNLLNSSLSEYNYEEEMDDLAEDVAEQQMKLESLQSTTPVTPITTATRQAITSETEIDLNKNQISYTFWFILFLLMSVVVVVLLLM